MKVHVLTAVACALVLASPGQPQTAKPAKPLFAADDEIHIVIQAPLQILIRNRSTETPIAGTLTEANGLALPINLTLRGHVNRTTDVCEFPPLRVEFTAAPPPASLFSKQKKLKLVTHCRNNASNQQYILLDYAAYRMYNLLTPRSFRARLASVDYRGADGKPITSRIGFFIEDEGDVAKRNGMREVKAPDRIPVTDLTPADAGRYALFEHMIGNHDWSMRAGPAGENCCHNAKLVGSLAPGQTVPIPYDFDFSGLVDAPYATVPEQLRINSVRDRFYRGYCVHNSDVAAAAAQMRAQKPAILSVLNQVPGLEDRTRIKATSYLEGFFTQIGTDADVNEHVLKRCLTSSP
jgi:hypothetical protein